MRVKRVFVDGAPDHLEIQHVVEVGGTQHFSPKLVERGAAEGWLTMGGGKIVLKTAEGEPDLEFAIIAPPGRYEDESEPAGYRVDNFYRCERVA
jgi:hypothetical protein